MLEIRPTKFLSNSTLDSNRFGIKIARGRVPSSTPIDEILSEVMSADATLVILRTDAGDSEAIVRLQRNGWPAIHADTLVYYGADLKTLGHNELPEGVRLATHTDRDSIHEIAEQGFAGYRSHYTANPLLPQEQILAGYIEWAKSRLDDEVSERCTWVVSNEQEVAGFATCDLSPEDRTIEIILNAVHPRFARKGHYGRLLRGVLDHYARQEFLRASISTQLWNYNVQRQWARAGLTMEKAYDTYHFDRRLLASGTMT